NQLGSGSSNARNRGLAIAEGQYIACLDADDEFKPNKLSTMIPLVEKYGAAVSEVEMRDSDSSALLDKFNKSSDSPCLSPKELLWVCLNTCSLYLYDRYKIPDLYYENDILRMQDLIFLMSFFNHIDLIGFTPEALHIYYKRQGSVCNSSSTHATFHQSKIKILDKIKNHQISVKNDLAIAEIQKALNLSLEIDKIYDQEVQKNPDVNWLDLFKAQVIALNYFK
ncbi:MAG: glycosyltransferase family 2 protein, partial [Microcystaceae cyanobacterium]